MLNLSRKELELKAKNRGVKDYKSVPIDKLLGILDKSEQVKETKAIRDTRKENFNNYKILRGIQTLYESDKGDYFKPIRLGDAFSSNHIEYERNEIKIKLNLLMIILI